MGRGIALTAARGGQFVTLCDPDSVQLAAAVNWAEEFLETSVTKGKISESRAQETLARFVTSDDPEAATQKALVIEALPEILSLKQRVLSDIQSGAEHEVTIHSNTSTLAIADIADGLPHPHLCVGTHYCNPAPIMPLVEVARGPETDEATVTGAVSFAESIGKTAIVLKDSPGLITNYLVVAFENEAARAVEAGLAEPDVIDRVTTEAMRFPIGPFRLLDIVGLDVHVAVSASLHDQLGDPQYEVPQLIHDMVARGELGTKTGRGFYNYAGDTK